jgi:NitT/TauT family transport system substrate-binding protein
MKKKTAAIWLSVVLCAAMLAGCGNAKGDDSGTQTGAAAQAGEAIPEEETATAQNEESGNDTGGNVETGEAAGDTAQNGTGQAGTETPDDGTGDSAGDKAETQATDSDKTADGEKTVVRVGSLKGPTSMGLVYLMDQAGKGESANQYEFTMTAAADELLPAMLSGELDIVLIPANMASVLYNRAEGDVSVIDINTLGVLYAVSGNKQIKEMKDLKGRTVYMTGKGTTPDYVMQYLLKENGLTAADVTLEYKSEAAEVAAMLAEMPEAVGVLPQPFVTAACAQNDKLSVVLDLTKQWAAVQEEGGSSLVTGVTVVRNALLTEAPAAVELFMEEHAASAAYANEHVEETAQLVAAAGIIDKAPVAAKALPECNITYIDGAEMKTALSGYLQVLWEQDPESVGGGLPGDGFYYVK